MNAVIYTRLSKDDTGEALGIETQIHGCRGYCEFYRMNVVGVTEDRGVSGSVDPMKRPGIIKALDLCKERGVEALVFHKIDRLGRNLRYALEFVEDILMPRGIMPVFVETKIDFTGPAGRFFFRSLINNAQFNVETISWQQINAAATKRRKGEKTGGVVPYGYRATVTGKTARGNNRAVLEPDPAEYPVLAKIVERCASLGPCRVANSLNEDGHARRNGSKWNQQSVYKIYQREMQRRKDSGE